MEDLPMPLSELLLPELDQETINTRKILERCPTDKFGWKPHEKSMTLGKLAAHLAGMPKWGSMTIDTDELNFEPGEFVEEIPPTTADMLAAFDADSKTFRDKLTRLTDEESQKPWALKASGALIFSMPKAVVLRSYVFNHAVHHRAQLGVYLRLLDILIPGLYGPSADE